MKVVIIGSKGFDTIEYHLADSLRFLGHDVEVIDIVDILPIPYVFNFYAIKFFQRYDEGLFKKLATKVIGANPDLVIGTYRFINPICIKAIKRALPNIPVIHINPDALITFELQQIFASPYDFYFTKDSYIVSFMKEKMNLNAFYLPEAFNPRVHQRPDVNREELEQRTNIDVLSFGYLYPYRANMTKQLIDSGLNVVLYGKKDRRFFKPELDKHFRNEWITGDRKSELLSGSKIVFNNFHYSEIESVNCKFFEIAGIGAFQICDYRPAIEEYSKINSAEFTFKSIFEAIELIKFYLDKPTIRHDLALSQYNHFVEHHTYEHRVKQIMETVFS